MAGLNIIFGAAGVGTEGGAFASQAQFDELAKLLKAGHCETIDTATLYGPSEKALSEFGAQSQFTIDTKAVGGFIPGSAKKEVVLEHAAQSEKFFGKVDVYYLHSPAKDVPLEETLEAINEIYKRGFFKRFGLSNFKPEAVQQAYDICKEKGYPLPSVYQGNYNPVARLTEETLFPLLRKLNISFNAYSPMAGGFLTKTKKDIEDGKGRFDPSTRIGSMYSGMYARPTLLEALAEWEQIAKEENVSRAELAYRWVNYHSILKPEHGDGLIFGASKLEQVEPTLQSLNKGPLSAEAAERIEAIWQKIKHEAPLDNLHQ